MDGGVLIRPVSRQQAERMADAIASVRGSADAGHARGVNPVAVCFSPMPLHISLTMGISLFSSDC